MTPIQQPSRRTFFGKLSALSAALLSPGRSSGSTGSSAATKAPQLAGFGSTGNVYEELGVTTVINARGTMTALGGSLPRLEVEQVMALGGQHFVSIAELEVAAGRRIAEMLKLPDGYSALVTSGAAAAMQSGLAGILTRDIARFIEQLPDLTGMKSEVIIQKSHRNPFDHQLRTTGVKLIEVESVADVRRAVNSRTAMMHFSNYANDDGQIDSREWLRLAREHKIPAFLDAAADTPPVSRLLEYAQQGYDLVAFSGGKAIRGPQCAGLLIGRTELVEFALLNNSPHEDTIGRGQKVGKEEIVGMVKAIELFLAEDHDALSEEWQSRLTYVARQVGKIPTVVTATVVPKIANHVPHLEIRWDTRRIPLSPRDAAQLLRAGKPSIALSADGAGDVLTMNSFMLKPGEEKVVSKCLVDLLSSHVT